MGFLAPWFLAGLAALGLPIYVHLLRQHKTEPLPFSSLMFFEQRTQSSIKHRRLRYLLLMALRLLLLFLIVLAFSNPFWKSMTPVNRGEALLVVAVDNSFSMRAGTRLADAKQGASGILAGKGGKRAQVIALGNQADILTKPEQDAGALRSAVESIQAGDGKTNFGEFSRAVRSISNAARAPLEVHLFSDFQRTGLPAGFNDLQMPSGAVLTLHPVANRAEGNFAVETVSAPATVWDTKKARVQATVSGYETQAAKKNVSLVVNGRVLQTKPVDLTANGRATVEFIGLEANYGFAKGEVRLDGSDALAGDDRMLFAVERADPKKALIVHEGRDSRSPLYYRAALGAASESAFTLDAMPVEQAGGLNLSRYAFVVVADVLSLPPSLEESLTKYVQTGGSVMLALGPSSARRNRLPVIGDPVSEGKYYSRDGARFDSVGYVDSTFAPLAKAAGWQGVRFYYAVRTPAAGARMLARLTDETPLLYEKRLGEGRVLVFASGLDNLTNDFPLSPAFVAFAEQSARYLAGVDERQSVAAVGTSIELRTQRETALGVEVIDPDGRRALSLAEASRAASFRVEREGYFEVRRANGRHEMIAVNADRRESDLGLIPDETRQLWSGSGSGDAQAGEGPAATGKKEEEQVHPFWWHLLLAALLAAVIETVVSSRYLGVEQEAS
jgi:hypothetical protein